MFAELLESRRLLAASFSATNGALIIKGTTDNDTVVVSIDPANSARLKVSESGVVTRFERARVKSVNASLAKGHDYFSMSEALTIPASVSGSGGRDTFLGGGGKDTLIGGESEDSLNGRGGDDSILGSQQTDELFGGAGTDVVSYEYVDTTFNFGDVRQGFGVIISLDGLRNDQEAGGLDYIDPTIENVVGTSFRDAITGNGKANTLSGLGGNDSIVGSGGNDLINGDKGVDTLLGGSGNDTLNGGDSGDEVFGNAGDDVIRGNAGADTFSQVEFDAGELADYAAGSDVLE